MSRRKLALAVLATVTVAATAVGMAVAGKGNGNNKTFEYAVGLWGDTSTPTSRLRPAFRT